MKKQNEYYQQLKKLHKNEDVVQFAMLYAIKDDFKRDKQYYVTLGQTKYKRLFFDATARHRKHLKSLKYKEDL